jgi:mono/diheme cytochrome c family protein
VKRSRLALAVAFVAVVAIAVTTMASGSGEKRAAARGGGAVTWAKVAPIFAEKCSGCHTPGGIAPFSLLSAKSAKAHANGILVMT